MIEKESEAYEYIADCRLKISEMSKRYSAYDFQVL
jgi:hypothetical protein